MTKLTTGWEVNEKPTNCEEQRDSNSNETRVLVSVSMYCEGNLKSYGSLPFNLSTVSRHDGTLFVFCCVIQWPNTKKERLFNFIKFQIRSFDSSEIVYSIRQIFRIYETKAFRGNSGTSQKRNF